MESENQKQSQEQDDCYATVEEYFIDMCRYGEIEEVKDCINDKTIKHFQSDPNGNTAIHMCSANGHIEILKILLELLKQYPELEQQKIINQQNIDGNTALHWAAINNKLTCVKQLIDSKADCNLKNTVEKNPMDEAIQMSHIEIADLLAPNITVDLEEYEDVSKENYQVFEKDEDDLEFEKEIASMKIDENQEKSNLESIQEEEEKKINQN